MATINQLRSASLQERTLRLLRAGFCLVWLGGVDTRLMAQDLFALSLEELMMVTVEVASRQPEPLQYTPAAVTVFSREDIERMGVRWLDELVQYVPGAYPHQRAGSAAPFWTTQFRGNPNENGSGLLLLIDGRRQNDAAFGTASTAWMRQSLAGFKRVEILRGPGSAIYGANATYAVINLITDPSQKAVTVAAGEHGATDVQLAAATSADDWRLSAKAQDYRDDGEQRAASDRFQKQTQTEDPQQASGVQLQLDAPQVSLFASQHHNTLDNYYVLATLADGINRSGTDLLEYGLRLHDLEWRGVDIGAMLNRRESDYELLSRLAPANTTQNSSAQDFVFRSIFHSETTTLELTSAGEINPRHHWQAGFEGYAERATADADATHDLATLDYLGGGLQQQPYNLMPDADRNGLGVYTHWQAQWTESVRTYLGLRRDDTDDVGGATSPRAALIYSGLPDQILKLAYVEAFRPPSLGELHLTSNPVNLGNDELQPVQLKNLELIHLLQGDTISLETSFYASAERDLILFRPISATTVQRFNVGELDTQGIEFALRWRADTHLELGLLGSHILDWDQFNADAVRVDDAAAVIPRDLATATLDWSLDRWQLHLAAHYAGEIDTITDTSPYTLGRLRIGYRIDPHQAIALTGSNLFDTQYDTVSDSAGLGRDAEGQLVRGAPQRGRQLLLSWTWDGSGGSTSGI